jgi:hypothetical protein
MSTSLAESSATQKNPSDAAVDRYDTRVAAVAESINRKGFMNGTPRSNKLGSRGSGASAS